MKSWVLVCRKPYLHFWFFLIACIWPAPHWTLLLCRGSVIDYRTKTQSDSVHAEWQYLVAKYKHVCPAAPWLSSSYCEDSIGPLNLISHCLLPDIPIHSPSIQLRENSSGRRSSSLQKKSKNNLPNQLLAHPLAPHSCSPHVIEWAME